jgi:hypothetical protein
MAEINKELLKELEKQFPKGHPYRGEAMVLMAIANMEINRARKGSKNKK